MAEATKTTATTATKGYFYALGRRKSVTARARLMTGKGAITINSKTAEDYFANSKSLLNELQKPFNLLEQNGKFDVTVIVSGGGMSGQAAAIRLAIAKALVVMNEDFKQTLKRADMLGRDPREKERKKFGLKGARKQRQFTKR
jgi:small subunit ribosomal protein S9